jgi:hypothetical protein
LPVIRLAVNKNEIRPDVAGAAIVPFAGHCVIGTPARQQRVGGEQVDDQLTTPISSVSSFLLCRPDFSLL